MAPEVAFGLVLRALRRERGLSQETLALDADLQRNYISLLERGLNAASIKTIFKLANALGISATELTALVEREIKQTTLSRSRLRKHELPT